MQLEFPFSRSAENREDELFHFISIFLSSAGKVRGRRRAPRCRYTVRSGRNPTSSRRALTMGKRAPSCPWFSHNGNQIMGGGALGHGDATIMHDAECWQNT